MYKHLFKRVIDLLVSIIVLIVTSPIILTLCILLHLFNDGTGAFFIQERPGKGGKIFKVIKFKTMTDKRNSYGQLIDDRERITVIGRIVRSLSFDELPQLINVIKGDMSLVGPRPLLVSYLPLYTTKQARRHEVKPGITGWAQVNGRNAISWEQKFEYDLWYVDNLSLWLDIKILLLTFKRVLVREGINASESVTMDYFQGTKEKQ